MDYLEFSKEMAILEVKRNKDSLRQWRGIFILNLICIVIEIYLTVINKNMFTAICAGALIGNILWIVTHLMCVKQDLKLDKKRLTHLENLSENKNYRDRIEQLKSSKDYYDKLIEIAIETQENNKKNNESKIEQS